MFLKLKFFFRTKGNFTGALELFYFSGVQSCFLLRIESLNQMIFLIRPRSFKNHVVQSDGLWYKFKWAWHCNRVCFKFNKWKGFLDVNHLVKLTKHNYSHNNGVSIVVMAEYGKFVWPLIHMLWFRILPPLTNFRTLCCVHISVLCVIQISVPYHMVIESVPCDLTEHLFNVCILLFLWLTRPIAI
jgi:hypothetical protein